MMLMELKIMYYQKINTTIMKKDYIKSAKITNLLGDSFNVETGKNVSRENRLILGQYEIMGANGCIGYTNKYLINKKCIITGRVGTIGGLSLINKKIWPSDNVLIISEKDHTNSIDFLYYYLKTVDFKTLNVGSTQPLITQTDIKNLPIDFPPNNEQIKIAEILSSLDDKIELNRRINANLEAMASALFKKWFVDIGDGLPEGWKIKPLQEVFDFLEGPGIRNWQYAKSGTRFINIRLINGGDIDVASANFINQKDVDTKYKHFLLKSRDMVLSTSGTLGKSAIVRKAHLPLLLNTSVIRFRPKDKNNYPFMYQFLQSQSFLEEQTSMASGSVQANFGPTHLKKMFILMPGDKILKLYNDTCSALYEEITSNLDQNDKLQNLRDSLLPRLMNGRIKV